MKSIIYSITKEELQNILNTSKTYGQVLRHFGLENKGGNHKTLKRRIKNENLDDSNIIKNLGFGGGWNKGMEKMSIRRMPLEEAMSTIFIPNYEKDKGQPRRYVRFYNLIEEKCSHCGLEKAWNGKPITLELEHIDGNSCNNVLSNLKWLCPNCHSQTDTFRGRNKRIKHFCADCNMEVIKGSIRCRTCNSKFAVQNGLLHNVARPTKEELENLLKQLSKEKIGQMFNVTGNAVKKWCTGYNI